MQLAPIVSCAEQPAWKNKKPKSFLQFVLVNLYHVGVCLYFPILVAENFSQGKRKHQGCKKKRGGMHEGGMRCLGNTEAQANEASGGEGWSDGSLFLRQLRCIPLPACCTEPSPALKLA